jgi:hypothetical protein
MDPIINWLLSGDISIVYQTRRDLLSAGLDDLSELQQRIETDGWGKRFLNKRKKDGHWGEGFYAPKWSCTHYTLLELIGIGIDPQNQKCRESARMILGCKLGQEGGINYARTVKYSDVCINGMVLNILCYFQLRDELLAAIVDYLLAKQMNDGGWNCRYFQGAVHSSLHTTVSVLEGFGAFLKNKYEYRTEEIKAAIKKGIDFILEHRLFRSHRTGKVIDRRMLRLTYPPRWHYDIVRGLDLFRSLGVPYDERMKDALEVLLHKRREDGKWPLQMKHEGKIHFDMEQVGTVSRWNTLRILRIFKYYGLGKDLV